MKNSRSRWSHGHIRKICHCKETTQVNIEIQQYTMIGDMCRIYRGKYMQVVYPVWTLVCRQRASVAYRCPYAVERGSFRFWFIGILRFRYFIRFLHVLASAHARKRRRCPWLSQIADGWTRFINYSQTANYLKTINRHASWQNNKSLEIKRMGSRKIKCNR